MLIFAAIEFAGLLALVVGVLGLGGIILSALKYNRDDTTAIIGQQNIILGDMKALNEELRYATQALKVERDELRSEVAVLTTELATVRKQMRSQ